MTSPLFKFFIAITLFHVFSFGAFAAPLRVENFARVKGQEKSTIRAYGIVSGLSGTGDEVKSLAPFAQMLLRQLSRSGMASGADAKGISSIKNSALVEVVVTIPATGGRDGDTLDCTIYSIGNAKSLTGGVLSQTMLSTGLQQDENALVYGMAQGRVTIEDSASPNVGRVVNGCRLLADFTNPYVKDGLVTLVIKKEFARPKLALTIADAINNDPEFEASDILPAKAINSNEVAVRMPSTRCGDPMDFIEQIMDVIIEAPQAIPRITINERAGTIAIDENVEVKPTLVTHKNIIAETAPAPGDPEEAGQRQFLDIDTDAKFRQMNGETVNTIKLKALQASLDAIKVTQQDIIDIIKILHTQGAIIGEVVFVD